MKREQKTAKDGKETKRRYHFLRIFEKYDIRNEQQFVVLGKWAIFIVLLMVELLALGAHIYSFALHGGLPVFIVLIATEVVLTLSETLKLFVVKQGKIRALFYALDALAACVFMFVTEGFYPIVIYMLVLTELYIGTKKLWLLIFEFALGTALYAASYIFQAYVVLPTSPDFFNLITQTFGYAFALLVHFFIMQVALAFYRQYLKLDKALAELDESKKELEAAYAVVAEVSVLEERQRIAKEIHDTAGHAVTTVIMQTEAAKLIIDKNPEQAKAKIIAANLQAKRALEELRNSVHLLSGVKENQTLKSSLENVLHESSDGTDIVIRSSIEEIYVSDAKFRLLTGALKEGISNGLRHGGATAFWFELRTDKEKIYFLLSDNGKGADESFVMGYGLSSMQERVKALGGEMQTVYGEDDGFELQICLPIDKQK